MEREPIISIRNLSKSFDEGTYARRVIGQTDLEIYTHEFVCLLGYSGCGKSTLLRLTAGFEKPDTGGIYIKGAQHSKPTRDAILLFQDFNQLLPWKTTLQNVMYPMITAKMGTRKQIQQKAMALLDAVGLREFYSSYPHTLSGGMKQRVAVARALALNPNVLLMDEPFASLDEISRRNIQKLTRDICNKHGVTVLFVTHSVDEAIIMSDRIVIMNSNPGRIVAILENQFRHTSDKQSKREMVSQIMTIMDDGITTP